MEQLQKGCVRVLFLTHGHAGGLDFLVEQPQNIDRVLSLQGTTCTDVRMKGHIMTRSLCIWQAARRALGTERFDLAVPEQQQLFVTQLNAELHHAKQSDKKLLLEVTSSTPAVQQLWYRRFEAWAMTDGSFQKSYLLM